MEAMIPFFMSSLMISTEDAFVRLASWFTVRVRGMASAPSPRVGLNWAPSDGERFRRDLPLLLLLPPVLGL